MTDIISDDPVFFTDTIIHSQLIKKKSSIWVTFRKEGIHKYPQAATDPKLATGDWLDVSFLGTPHRHIFHFRVEMEVFHDDRDVEFIQAKRTMERWYSQDVLQLDYKSCEMIAKDSLPNALLFTAIVLAYKALKPNALFDEPVVL